MNETELKQIALGIWKKDHTTHWGNKDNQYMTFGAEPHCVRLQKFGGSWCAMINGKIIYVGGFSVALTVAKNLVDALIKD